MNRTHTLIVGGTGATGIAVARRFAKRGAVSVISRHVPYAPTTRLRCLHHWYADVGNSRQLLAALESITAKNGQLDNLILLQRYRTGPNEWLGEFAVSLSASRQIIEYAKDRFRRRKGNSIVVVTSVAAHFIADEQPLSYHVAKAGLYQMTRYYAVKLGPQGIRVNSVAPGTIDKFQPRPFRKAESRQRRFPIPLGRLCTPEDIADVIEFLCGPRALFITGQNLILDGGLSLLCHASMSATVPPHQELLV